MIEEVVGGAGVAVVDGLDGRDGVELGEGEEVVVVAVDLGEATAAAGDDDLADGGLGGFAFGGGDGAVAVGVPAVAEGVEAAGGVAVVAEGLAFLQGDGAVVVDVVDGEVFRQGAVAEGAFRGGSGGVLGPQGSTGQQDGEEESENGSRFHGWFGWGGSN